MRIACVGAGPGGLYLSIMLSQPGSRHEVTVFERGPEGMVSGWGITLVDGLIDTLAARDAATAARVEEAACTWDAQVIALGDFEHVVSPAAGHSIRRTTLNAVLADRARELGVVIHYDHRVLDESELAEYDLVVAADGANSSLRSAHAEDFGTTVDVRPNRYTWLGTAATFERFRTPFVRTHAGWVWAGANSFEPGTSGFFVEMSASTWEGLGYDRLSPQETLRSLEQVFAHHLDGHPLLPQTGARGQVPWMQFARVSNERWHSGNLVLLGDAAHTLHFSVGLGTTLAMTDAMVLADVLGMHAELEPALEEYGRRRRADIAVQQAEAYQSMLWFERVDRYAVVGRRHFAMLLNRRRSTVHARIPVRLYVVLADVAAALPALGSLRARVTAALGAIARTGASFTGGRAAGAPPAS